VLITDSHDITEILLKVALNTINQIKPVFTIQKDPLRTTYVITRKQFCLQTDDDSAIT